MILTDKDEMLTQEVIGAGQVMRRAPVGEDSHLAHLADSAAGIETELKHAFYELRGLVGEVGGLLILVLGTRQTCLFREPTALARCTKRCHEIQNSLQRCSSRGTGLLAIKVRHLLKANELCRGLIEWVSSQSSAASASFLYRPPVYASLAAAHAAIKEAQWAELGMEMVDFADACCAHGGHTHTV